MPSKSAKASMSCGQVKRSSRPGKKIMKLYCLPGGKKKLVHAGAVGYKNNYSDGARRNFKARHRCSSAQPGTARHLACTQLWRKGGRKTMKGKGRRSSK